MKAILLAVALSVAAPLSTMATTSAWAAEGGDGPAEVYVKLSPIALEFWDDQGLFHMLNIELSVAFPSQTSINKQLVDKITRTLSAMQWEELSKDNPAVTIKAIALEVVRKESGLEKAKDVLLTKLVIR